jgi:hypothetical protein
MKLHYFRADMTYGGLLRKALRVAASEYDLGHGGIELRRSEGPAMGVEGADDGHAAPVTPSEAPADRGTLPRSPTTARKPSATRPRWNARAKRRAIASVFAPPKNNLASATRR